MLVFSHVTYAARHKRANKVSGMKLRDNDEGRVINVTTVRCQRVRDLLANGGEPLRKSYLIKV
jgi:hypothetical protein